MKTCGCGCGNPVKRTYLRGHNPDKGGGFTGHHHNIDAINIIKKKNKGKPSPFKGKHHKPETIELFKKINSGENNPHWKGDEACLQSIHDYIRRRKIKPDRCEDCGKTTDDLDLANISQQYLRDPDDYEWLCRMCHMTKDGRRYTLKYTRYKNA